MKITAAFVAVALLGLRANAQKANKQEMDEIADQLFGSSDDNSAASAVPAAPGSKTTAAKGAGPPAQGAAAAKTATTTKGSPAQATTAVADPGEIPDFNKTGLLPEVTFIHKVGLYPENADYSPDGQAIYFSSLYGASPNVFKYNPRTKKSSTFDLPLDKRGIDYHISGISRDRFSLRTFVIANPGETFDENGTWEALEKEAKARSFVFVVERNDKVTFDFGLNQARDAAMKMNGNIPVGGFQDVTSDSRGNIYALGSFGSVISKTSPVYAGKAKQLCSYSTDLFYADPKPRVVQDGADRRVLAGFSGIERDGDKLIVFESGVGLKTFDINFRPSPKAKYPQPTLVKVDIPNVASIAGDGFYLPPTYGGKVALINDLNQENHAVHVVKTKDDWETAEYLGGIDTSLHKILDGEDESRPATEFMPTATYDFHGKQFISYEAFDGGKSKREEWPQKDITKALRKLVEGRQRS